MYPFSFLGGVPLQSLTLGWDDIANANFLVGDASNVNDWNTFFDLPINGTPFTSVVLDGNEVRLFGGSDIDLRYDLFYGNSSLLSVVDNADCIITASDYCFAWCSSLTTVDLPLLETAGFACFQGGSLLTTLDLPSLTTAGNNCFSSCTSLTTIDLPSCINLGSSVGNDYVFDSIIGNTITLTVPTALMTCNGGNPDGDIQYLQANNTVTIITT
jgi:hypothetical protein